MRKRIGKFVLRLLFAALMVISILKVYWEIDVLNYELNLIEMKRKNQPTAEIQGKLVSKTIDVNGCEVHYVVSKEKKEKSIVFLHPAFADNTIFSEQFAAFMDEYTVIAVDLVGHGLTKTKGSKDKIDASRDHIAQILEQEGIQRTNLVGVSIGSLIAQYFALKYPEKVHSLTALGGYNINKTNDEIAKSQRLSNIGLVVRALFSMKAFRKKSAEISCASAHGRALFYNSSKFYTRSSFSKMQGLSKVIADRNVTEVSYPTFILTAEHDIDLAKRMAESWHKESTNSEYLMIDGAGHCANVDQPEAFNRALRDFLDRNN